MTTTTKPQQDYRQFPYFSNMTEEQISKYWRAHSIDHFIEVCPGYFPEYKGDEQLFYCYFPGGELDCIRTFYEESEFFEHLTNYCHPDDESGTIVEYPPITTPVTGYFINADWEGGGDSILERGTCITLNSAEDLKAWFRCEFNPSYNGDSAFIYWEDASGHREYVWDDVWCDLAHLYGERNLNSRQYVSHGEYIWGSNRYLEGVFGGTTDDDEDYTPTLTGDDIVRDALESLKLAKELKAQGLIPDLIKSVVDYLLQHNIQIKHLQDEKQTHDGCIMYQTGNTLPMEADRWYKYFAEVHPQLARQDSLRIFATVLMTNHLTTLLQCISVWRAEFGLTTKQMQQVTSAGLELFEVFFKTEFNSSKARVWDGSLWIEPDRYLVRELQLTETGQFKNVSVPEEVRNAPHLAEIVIKIVREMNYLRKDVNETDTDRYPKAWGYQCSFNLRQKYNYFYDTLNEAVAKSGLPLTPVQAEWFDSLHYALECFLYPMQEDEEGYNTNKEDRIRRGNFLREFFNLGDRYDLSSGTVTDDGWLVIQEQDPMPPTKLRCLWDHFHSSHFTYPWTQDSREFFMANKDEILSVPSLKAYSEQVLAFDFMTDEEKWDDIYENCSWYLKLDGCDGTVSIDPKGRELHKRSGRWYPRVELSGSAFQAWTNHFHLGECIDDCFADPCTNQEDVDTDWPKLREQVARRPNRSFPHFK